MMRLPGPAAIVVQRTRTGSRASCRVATQLTSATAIALAVTCSTSGRITDMAATPSRIVRATPAGHMASRVAGALASSAANSPARI